MNETIRRGNISLTYAISFFMFAAFTGLLLAMALRHDAPAPNRLSIERAPVRDRPFFKDEPATPEVKAAPQEPPHVQPPVTSGAGFPASRVRSQHLIENWADSPEAYLLEGRIVLRDFQVQAEGEGMRISGRIWSDFEVEAGHGHPAEQLLGLTIEVGLYEIFSDLDDRLGALVSSQWVRCDVDESERTADVELGMASFSLPSLSKPLPPGIYRLACKLDIPKQSRACKEALLRVRDLYGTTTVYDRDGRPTGETREVYGSQYHKDFWKDIIENEACRSQGTLYVADTLEDDGPRIDALTICCSGADYGVLQALTWYESQRTQLDSQYNIILNNPNLDDNSRRKSRLNYEQSMKMLKMLFARSGGEPTAFEMQEYLRMTASIHSLKQEIVKFEDDLTLNYWIALDTFHYAFHTINKAGYNCAVAIDKGDNTLDRNDRETKLQARGKQGRDENRREALFQYIPEPIKKAAYEYYRLSEETPFFDSETLTRRNGRDVQLDPLKWSEFRVEFLKNFRKQSAAALTALDLSERYAIQKWGDVYKLLTEVRDNIIVNAYCYEHYLRMIPVEKEIGQGGNKNLRADVEKQMLLEWEAEVGVWATEMKPLFDQAKVSPSAVYGRWESANKQARKLLDLPDFAYRYMLSVQKKTVPPPRRYK